jgi:hypothetical protein
LWRACSAYSARARSLCPARQLMDDGTSAGRARFTQASFHLTAKQPAEAHRLWCSAPLLATWSPGARSLSSGGEGSGLGVGFGCLDVPVRLQEDSSGSPSSTLHLASPLEESSACTRPSTVHTTTVSETCSDARTPCGVALQPPALSSRKTHHQGAQRTRRAPLIHTHGAVLASLSEK